MLSRHRQGPETPRSEIKPFACWERRVGLLARVCYHLQGKYWLRRSPRVRAREKITRPIRDWNGASSRLAKPRVSDRPSKHWAGVQNRLDFAWALIAICSRTPSGRSVPACPKTHRISPADHPEAPRRHSDASKSRSQPPKLLALGPIDLARKKPFARPRYASFARTRLRTPNFTQVYTCTMVGTDGLEKSAKRGIC